MKAYTPTKTNHLNLISWETFIMLEFISYQFCRPISINDLRNYTLRSEKEILKRIDELRNKEAIRILKEFNNHFIVEILPVGEKMLSNNLRRVHGGSGYQQDSIELFKRLILNRSKRDQWLYTEYR
jgi:hypothetical protein